MDDFKIEYNDYFGVVITKNGVSIDISKSKQDDIYFRSNESVEIPIKLYSHNEDECRVAGVFTRLMELIIGKSVLIGDNRDDFIDFDNKTITIHSDTGCDILRLFFNNSVIVFSITNTNIDYNGVCVRIRENGSLYSKYYQFFDALYYGLKNCVDMAIERKRKQ